jgi:hypothetical protein
MKRFRMSLMAMIGLAMVTTTFALDYTWTNTATAQFNTTESWSPNGTPGVGDTGYLTNNTTARNINMFGYDVTIANWYQTNQPVNTSHSLTLSGAVFQVTGTTVLGKTNNNLAAQYNNIAIGNGANGFGTFSNNNLYILNNGSISFVGTTTLGPRELLVAGEFTNCATSWMGTADSNANSWKIWFMRDAIVTNNGVLSARVSSGGAGTNYLIVGTSALNTFYNNGAVYLKLVNNVKTIFTFSNQLVNAGSIILTNRPSNATGGSLNWNVVGIAGTAVTNLPTGSISWITGTNGAAVPLQNNTVVNNGGFVNQGQLTMNVWSPGAAGKTNMLTLSDGSAFSNDVSGQLILPTENVGYGILSANQIINTGTNLVNGGTLLLQTSSGGALAFTNAGVIKLGGGVVQVSSLVNNGRIQGVGQLKTDLTNAGILAPGNSAGALTNTGNLTLAPSSALQIEIDINAGVTNFDFLKVTGSASLTGQLDVVLLNETPAEPDSYIVLIADGGLSGSFTNVVGGQVNAYSGTGTFLGKFNVNYGANDLTLTFIPEPSALTLVGFALGLTALILRRRR